MLKRLFLSIIILSALTSEGGVLYAADLYDYCLVNFAHLDMVQDSRNAISSFDTHKLNSLDKKGTPVAFYKMISLDAINSKVLKRDNHLEFLWLSFAIVLAFFIVSYHLFNYQISKIIKCTLLFFADSSPPVCC